ncbi:M15 family metallopeptidase [Bradyrhizobium acaciae]|uniref:M15 family metallopeptidase n=1 Tax=Bradyrhizobium acaciae TaxID=2683706 RepID=UPI001E5ED86E|nr:M15 family metallopeptidase [Bradyrhizobium acaciae]MCC8980587.1 M15 family metallopeptidase [Bradyrhizobium acaciae]
MRARWTACLAALLALLPQLARAQSKSELLDRLVRAYPDALSAHDDTTITWRDGTVMPVDDGVSGKSFDQMLRNASILDQMRQPYPSGPSAPPAQNVDPGRFRNEAFFKKMYGDCNTAEVRRNLVTITWLPRSWGKPVQVTRVNGVAERLKQVSAEIEALDPALRAAAFPIAGVLSCRAVADTGRMSMHGYAAAIDLNLKVSDYWLWVGKGEGKGAGKGKSIPYKNRMPREIVDIFERHGFIWGGKWYHYDTMHFEYRPELLQQ